MSRSALHGSVPIALLVLVALVGPAVASPQPDQVCRACSSSFERAASEHHVPLDVTESTATVRLHENRSATWIVTNRINESAAADLAASQGALDGIARTALDEGWGLPHDSRESPVTFQSASLTDRTVTIRFRQADAGERHLGLLVVDTLHTDGARGGWIVNADRFTIVGPPGTAVVNDPAAAIDREYTEEAAIPTVDGRRITWRGSSTARSEAAYDDDLYVVYGSSDATGLRTGAAVALATAPIWLDNVRSYVLPALFVYGLALAGVALAVRRFGSGRTDRLAAAVTAFGLCGVAASLAAPAVDQPDWFGGLAAVYLVVGAVASGRPDTLRSLRGTVTVALGSVVAAGVTLSAAALVGDPTGPSVLRTVEWALYHLPVAVAPAFGFSVAQVADRGRIRTTGRAIVGAGSTFALAGLVLVPVARRAFPIVLLFTVGGALIAGVVSVPLAVLGARLSDERASDEIESDQVYRPKSA